MGNVDHIKILWENSDEDINFSWAYLSWAYLSWADLREANLSKAVLVETNLEKATLTGCKIYAPFARKY